MSARPRGLHEAWASASLSLRIGGEKVTFEAGQSISIRGGDRRIALKEAFEAVKVQLEQKLKDYKDAKA